MPLVGGREYDRIGRVVDVHAIDVVVQVAAVGRFAALVRYVPAPILAADVDRAFEAADEFGVGDAIANLGAAQIAEQLAERERRQVADRQSFWNEWISTKEIGRASCRERVCTDG